MPVPDALQIATAAVRAYAESHPRPTQVTMRQAAEMVNRSEKTISNMVRRGDIKLNGFGLIPIAEIDRVLSARSEHSG
ncbi:MAG TPA: helix-turn-helix domain-containing protein [Rhodocyclaceae bacterium]|nr:helix-turn-helix domain-containing protein [Rhodocyclaceae bacterium]HRP76898.1 helix-turn-helix domain-containing protein [Rhodocyclaceae bacterium]